MAWSPYTPTPSDQADQTLAAILLELIDTNRAVLLEMKLLNARFEEAFETRIVREDVNDDH